jgi:type IV pilus assembly protein PilA
MLSKFFNKKSRGFTLVELLIVVAIIGVLSTLGVPTFRRMIQKSKKSEAKVNLGGLFTAQSAFQAEYNTYGNYLTRIGFQIDGAPATMTYQIGFMGGSAACAGVGAVAPTAANPTGQALNASFPQYYSTGWNSTFSWAGYNGGSGGCSAVASDVAATGLTFTALAQGVVSPNFDKPTAGGAAANRDVWTIDQTRTLVNVNDGVQ